MENDEPTGSAGGAHPTAWRGPLDDVLVQRFVGGVLQAESAIAEGPHIVVCAGTGQGAVHIGPFADGAEARAEMVAHACAHVGEASGGAACSIQPLLAG